MPFHSPRPFVCAGQVSMMLILLVDGVAPRAKMNQQRSRRFRAAQEARIENEKNDEFHRLLVSTGQAEPGSAAKMEKKWDTNVITPGTMFMHTLAKSLRYWVSYKLNTDPAWAKLKVIISDASVPGEGEHKVMEFIRSQRRSPDHDPNTKHVIYGLDADLIMLGLATHEPHFRVLREDVFFQDGRAPRCHVCNQTGHMAAQCKGQVKVKEDEADEKEEAVVKKPYIWLHVSALREYLEIDLQIPHQPFKFDLERAIDDYVFLCFFVGNDFLPHLPSLEIREEGIDTLVAIWRDNLPRMGGYVTKDGHVDLDKAQLILDGLAKRESSIFKRRREQDLRKQQRDAQRNEREAQRNERNGAGSRGGRGQGPNRSNDNTPGSDRKKRKVEAAEEAVTFAPGQANSREVREMGQQMFVKRQEMFQAHLQTANTANKSAAAVIKEQLLRRQSSNSQVSQEGTEGAEGAAQTSPSTLGKRKAPDGEDGEVEVEEVEPTATPGRSTPVPHVTLAGSSDPPPDDVRLWESGYEERYYQRKFGASPTDLGFRRQVAAAYVEGVCWVLLYYMQGCPSWQWYYPYHYAPFAADFTAMVELKPTFDNGSPFHPFEQLMGVFPADSGHAIPQPFRSLMTEKDSPILDFYPEDFDIDLNGKKFSWQGVALLPFIDEKRLLDAMKSRAHLLTEDEAARNTFGRDELLCSGEHPMLEDIRRHFYSKRQSVTTFKLDAQLTEGLSGEAAKIESFLPNCPLEFPLETTALPSLPVDNSMSIYFDMPKSTSVHKSQLLRGVEHPPRVLDSNDIDQHRHRAKRGGGRSYGGAPLQNDRRQSGGRPEGINYSNPFAAHLNFGGPNNMGRGQQAGSPPAGGFGGVPPPPWVAAQMGFVPPPPPGFGNGMAARGNRYNNGYGNGHEQSRGSGRGGGYQQHDGQGGYQQRNGQGGYQQHNGQDGQGGQRRGGGGGYNSRGGHQGGGYNNGRDSRNNAYGRR
jgi:5'-3' exoribonuclease 2